MTQLCLDWLEPVRCDRYQPMMVDCQTDIKSDTVQAGNKSIKLASKSIGGNFD